MSQLDADYWNSRYARQNTPWDIGGIAPQIKSVLDKLDPQLRILVPGAGRAYEAAYLHQKGFRQVFVCDWAPLAIQAFREQCPGFPESNLIVGDFFALAWQGDLILEQTFFCAIHPSRRSDYAKKAAELLLPTGKITGLLFAQPFSFPGPPFGGTPAEYEACFSPYFSIDVLELSQGSIRPRAGNELFFQFSKK